MGEIERLHATDIRPATSVDLSAVQSIAVQTWRHTYRQHIPQSDIAWFLDRAYAIPNLERTLTSPGTELLVAEHQKQVIGYAMTGLNTDSSAELLALYVLPEHQGRGAGYALWCKAIARASRLGAERIEFWVLTANIRARQFYERQGAVMTTERDLILGRSPIHETGYAFHLPATHPIPEYYGVPQ